MSLGAARTEPSVPSVFAPSEYFRLSRVRKSGQSWLPETESKEPADDSHKRRAGLPIRRGRGQNGERVREEHGPVVYRPKVGREIPWQVCEVGSEAGT